MYKLIKLLIIIRLSSLLLIVCLFKKRKTCTYVDHDQKAEEEDIQMAAELAWSGSTRRRLSDIDSDSHTKTSACRQSVTYEDIAPPPVAWQKNQTHVSSKQNFAKTKMKHTDNGYHRYVSGYMSK